MKIWKRATEFIQDHLLSLQIRRIDDNGERVSRRLNPIGVKQGWYDVLPLPAEGGWLRCDGTLYHQKQFPELYNVLGNTYGGTPGLTFAVPTVANTIILAGKNE